MCSSDLSTEQRQLILVRRAGPWAERFAVAALVAHVIDVDNLWHVDPGNRDRDVRTIRTDFGTDFTDRRTGQTAVLFMNFHRRVIQDSAFRIDIRKLIRNWPEPLFADP